MVELVNAAQLVTYNANVRGNDVGDCVCRSISFAFDISYTECSKRLNAMMHQKHQYKWNITPVFRPVIESLGGRLSDEILTAPYQTVEEFADDHSEGCYLIMCGKDKDNRRTSHIVCIVDGKIYDSWDCRKWYCKSYYICSGDRHVAESNLLEKIDNLAEDAEILLRSEIDKYCIKWIEPLTFDVIEVHFEWTYCSAMCEDYMIEITNKFKYELTDREHHEDHAIRFKVAISLKPGMSEEDAKVLITKTVKQRAYDRMYAIRENIKKDLEAFEARYAEGADTADQSYMYLTPAEERFFKQLPGKIRPYVVWINIQKPGMYSNSYSIRLKQLPADTGRHQDKFNIEAPDAATAKDMILRYVNKLERPYEDYSPAEEYDL